MAPNGLATRKSFLSITPVNVSLKTGTAIPPPDSPPRTPDYFDKHNHGYQKPRPPTAGGGPLNSHPTTPEGKMPGAFSPTPEPEKLSQDVESRVDSMRNQSWQAMPERGMPPLPSLRNRQPRRLFSLTNLRQSFGSSRASLRPFTSTPAPVNTPPTFSSLRRPSSPAISYTATVTSNFTAPVPMGRKERTKSGSWFRRKSQIFNLNSFGAEESHGLGSVMEGRPGTGESGKTVKSSHAEPAPQLPQLFVGEPERGGDIGWDEEMFRKW